MGKRYVVCKSTGSRIHKRSCTYVVRSKKGTFKKWTNIGRSARADSRVCSKHKVKSGYGHLGDIGSCRRKRRR